MKTWKYVRYQDGIVVKDENNDQVCAIPYTHRSGMNEKIQANASLIVTAPELFSLLENLFLNVKLEISPAMNDDIRTALKRARGEV